jgi:flagellar hook assembly protein FlgD
MAPAEPGPARPPGVRLPCCGVVLRKLLIAVALAALAALPASASPDGPLQLAPQTLLMPGVTYQRQVQFTPHGPVVLDVVTAPRPDGSTYTLAPALSNNAIVATEKLTDMEKDVSGASTAVGVNGDYFVANPGKPTGMLMRSGALDSAPFAARSSLGIAADGTLTVAKVSFDGTWRGSGQRRQLDLNAAPVKGHTTLYTSAWGPATPAESGVAADVIQALPPAAANRVVSGVVTQVLAGGPVPIPPGGAVLVSRGGQAPHLTAEAPAGTTVELRLTLTPNWSGMVSALGGGPLLVSNGKAVFRARESFGDPLLSPRSARSAVGQLSDGRILLVTAEGGNSSYSAGMTNYELAVALARLGARTAMALGSGPSAAMAFDGSLLTKPTGPSEQPIADALLLTYNGVYAAPPAASVLSPNGDGVDDTQQFAYKLVRASQVTASLVGPDRSTRTLVQDVEQPGVHTVDWDGKDAAEGNWRFVVTATDDLGHATSADRTFALNDTLGSVAVTPASAQLRRDASEVVAATFDLAHPASVTVTVEKRSGIVIATLLSKQLDPGTQKVVWNGRLSTGSLATTGEYQVRVVAANSIGKTTVTAPFTARRS